MGDRQIRTETLSWLKQISVTATQIRLMNILIQNHQNASLKSAVTFDRDLALQIREIDCYLRIKLHI